MPEEYYKEALKLGQKEYRACVARGQSPCLPVLDDFIPGERASQGVDLGLIQIPAEMIVGTKSRGRVFAFAPNFMPILEDGTEFADKWKRLCDAHVTEGIRDPIKAYEYMNRYYVEEGNKRVSVLKFFDAYYIAGNVTRILPERNGDEEVEIYYEFLDFYKITKINFIEFSKRGSYTALLKSLGKATDETWTEDERREFSGVYYYFRQAYISNGGDKLQSTVGDAMLSYIHVYGFEELKSAETADIKKNLSKMWEEVALKDESAPIEIKSDPPEEKKPTVLTRVLTPSVLKVGFLYDGTPERSGWVHDHEEGRLHVSRVFEGKVETFAYQNVMENDPLEVTEQAIRDGCRLLFTTTPRLLQASLRAAVDHPDVVVLNCSLNTQHRYILTYYTRMYEAKFILGALAGSLSESGQLGYVCDYPIFGQIAGINAFALGAQMVNPRAKVHLEWSGKDDPETACRALEEKGIHLISSLDTARYLEDRRSAFGLSYLNGDDRCQIAVPVYKWGVYYEEILRRVLNRTLQTEYDNSTKALNYYWGMSAGVVDVEYAADISTPSRKFADFLRDGIIHNVCTPFLTPIVKQDGQTVGEWQKSLSLENIMHMDYLVENVIGELPKYEELTPMGKATVDTAGVDKAQTVPVAADIAKTDAAKAGDES